MNHWNGQKRVFILCSSVRLLLSIMMEDVLVVLQWMLLDDCAQMQRSTSTYKLWLTKQKGLVPIT